MLILPGSFSETLKFNSAVQASLASELGILLSSQHWSRHMWPRTAFYVGTGI